MVGIAKIHDVDVLRRLSHLDTTGSSTDSAAKVGLTRATDVISAQLKVRSLVRQFLGRSPDLRGQMLTESRYVCADSRSRRIRDRDGRALLYECKQTAHCWRMVFADRRYRRSSKLPVPL